MPPAVRAYRRSARGQYGAILQRFLAETRGSKVLQLNAVRPSMKSSTANQLVVQRASSEASDVAWKIIEEYYEAASVVARDTKEDFVQTYFRDGAGVWLAIIGNAVVGCIAMRVLAKFDRSGEVKRLYVQPQYRGRGIAASLYQSLESYARDCGHEWLYLDTTDEMVEAQKFYAALGYEIISRYNDNPQATIFMRKQLRNSAS